MDTAQIVVTLGGIAAIGGVIWYFFLGEREPEVGSLRPEDREGG